MTLIQNPKVVYVIGASGRAAAESVRQSGLRTIVVDLYSDCDSGDHADVITVDSFPDSIVDQLRILPAGWVLLAGGMEHHLDAIAELERYHRLIGPSVDQIKWLRDFHYLSNSLTGSLALHFPETLIGERNCRSEAIRLGRFSESNLSIGTGWLKKSLRGCGGFHIEPSPRDCPETIDYSTSYFQQRILGRSIGTVFYCQEAETKLLGATESISKELHESLVGPQPELPAMAYRGSFGPIEIPGVVKDRMCRWIHSLSKKIDYQGLIQADWILDPNDEAWLLEINPRWTSSMEIIEWAMQENLFTLHASFDSDLRNAIPHASDSTNRTAPLNRIYKSVVYSMTNCIFSLERSQAMLSQKFHRFENNSSARISTDSWADIPRAGSLFRVGDPIASLFTVY